MRKLVHVARRARGPVPEGTYHVTHRSAGPVPMFVDDADTQAKWYHRLKNEYARWDKVIREARIKID